MDKAEYVFKKLGFSIILKDIKNIAKYKKYIAKPLEDTSKINRSPASKKATKKAIDKLKKLNS